MDNLLQQTISNIVRRIEGIEKELERHKKKLPDASLSAVEPTLFIKGKYLRFHKDNQALEILVHGENRFYSLANYYSEYLPFPDSTVVIFSEKQSGGKKPVIVSMNKGELEYFAKMEKFIFHGVRKGNAVFKHHLHGYLDFVIPENLNIFKGIKIGQKLKFREVKHGVQSYFIPCDHDFYGSYNRFEILKNL